MKLVEYASTRRKKSICSICALPPAVLAEVTQGRKDGIIFSVIAAWLKDEKKVPKPPSEASLYGHFRREHDVK